MFEHLIDILDGHGLNAYRECARAARLGAKNNPDLAAGYALIGFTAQHFAEAYRGEPLSSKRANLELARFRDYVRELDVAYQSEDTDERLKALNSVAYKSLD